MNPRLLVVNFDNHAPRENLDRLVDNKQKDDHGHPMKNWWPFLFY